MKLDFSVCRQVCEMDTFRINGIEADVEDFGDKYDHDPDGADPYCCGDMRFDPKNASDVVLRKYNITEAEYMVVAERLEDALEFEDCGMCA